MYLNILIFLLILILILIIANIIILCHNKLSYMGSALKKGGALTEEDIDIINDQIMRKLYEFNLILPQSAAMSTKLPAVISLTNISIAKASILEKRGRCSIANELDPLYKYPNPIKSDVYFYMIKITDDNISQWKVFEQKIKSMEESIQVMYNSIGVKFTAGLNFFNIKKRREDLFVAYASIMLNETIFPPDWRDVECMVSIIAKEGIPYFTNMGIFTMMHTFPLDSYSFEDLSSKKLILLPYISGNDLDTDLSNYFTNRTESYPAHKYISAHLFTFIGIHINNFYVDEKTALFTSPTDGIAIILSKVFNKYKIIYGYETDRESRYLGLEKGNKPDDSFVRIVLYNGATQAHLDLNKNELKKLCPWYCNIFLINEHNTPPDTPECYSSVIYTEPFVYVPVSSFIELSSKEEYAFISIDN